MRIYIYSNLHINNNNNIEEKLKQYLFSKTYISYIWSINGVLEVENNKIYNIDIVDVPVIKTIIGAFPSTIDKSEFIRTEECYQIQPRSYNEYIKLCKYRLSESSELEWIIEYKDNKLYNNYFYLPSSDENKVYKKNIQNELLTFLNF